MRTNYQKYTDFMTYKIVHYLAMVSRKYIKRIRLEWILNDIDQIYLKKILKF